MIEILRSKEFVRLWMPALAVLAVGLLAAAFLAVIVVQRFSTDKPAERIIATGEAIDPAPVSSVDVAESDTAALAPVDTAKPVSRQVTPRKSIAAPVQAGLSVAISEDGCTVTATGVPGTSLVIKASNDRKGGESTYTFPADGQLIERSGGIAGMAVVAELYQAYVFGTEQTPLASATGVIVPPNCWD